MKYIKYEYKYYPYLKCYILNDVLNVKGAVPIPKEDIEMVDALLNIKIHFPLDDKSGVYKIIFSDNSYYIGKSKNIIKRLWEHLCEIKNPIHNIEFYTKFKQEVQNEINVIKLSDQPEDEYKMLELHLSFDKNFCYNKTKNTRIKK
jgi:hypothetical protein